LEGLEVVYIKNNVTCVHMRLPSCSHLCSDSIWAGGNHNSVHL